MRFAPILLCAVWFLTGCTRTVSYQRLQQESSKHAGATFPDTTFYCGTKDGFDYFHIQPGIGTGGGDYRVAVAGSPHTNRFEFTSDRSRWITVWPISGLTQGQLERALTRAVGDSRIQNPTPVDAISVGMTRAETLRRLRENGAVEVAKDVLPDGKGWAIAGRHDCLFLRFTNDILASIGVELNADKPKMYRSGYATNTYSLR